MKYPKTTEAILTLLIYLAPLSPILFDFFKPINQGYSKAEYTKIAELYHQIIIILLLTSWLYLSNVITKFLLK